jgi:spermidine synthase
LVSLLQVLFFCSGVSGLIYQVIWVRQFGQAFGNTIHSASLVVAIFMLGLGVGGYLLGALADRRYRDDGPGLLRAYAGLEVVIAVMGLSISLTLPHLTGLVARLSAYSTGAEGWQSLTLASYMARTVIALLMLAPITILMGGTLTVLVRYIVRLKIRDAGWSVALLYGANTIGAAAGAFLTDFLLAPSLGLRGTQLAAVGLNLGAAAGALLLSRHRTAVAIRLEGGAAEVREDDRDVTTPAVSTTGATVHWTAGALALSGFAALGMEILWLRHLGLLLGGFRAVFSLLLAVMLLALGVGAFLGGWLDRRFGRPVPLLMMVQASFAAAVLLGLAVADHASIIGQTARLTAGLRDQAPLVRGLLEVWFNVRPMLLEVALPSLIAGCAFPLANAIVQRSARTIGQRAGLLYAANTVGAVCGSLATGYLLLPVIGLQAAATLLAAVAALAIVPLYLSRDTGGSGRIALPALVTSAVLAAIAMGFWLALPSDHVLVRALGERDANERLLNVEEGPTELVAVVEISGRGRGLLTNGHAMSSTARLDQRYMRALAHVPLLSLANPERVLVIGFGVGNTAHAATLHPSVARVEVADLSRSILNHASYFTDANQGVLRDPKVSVFVNDGRMHLEMAEADTYDLITLEPPPIAHAGVASLYSREFYELAKSRLKQGGYVSQWLPAYQVPAESSLAMVRAFIDVFPRAVLLSGTQAELLLLGTNGPRIEFDPEVFETALSRRAAVRQDLAGIELARPVQMASMFVGSADTLQRATRAVAPVTDDLPIQEYGVRSALSAGLTGVPSELFELSAMPAWCPRCYEGGSVAPRVAGLDLLLALMQQAYTASVSSVAAVVGESFGGRRILDSAYLGSVVPDSAEVHNILGIAALREDRVEDAIAEFEAALARDPRSANARANLGQIHLDQAVPLMETRRYAEAVPLLRLAAGLMPEDAGAQNDLGVALASLGEVNQAVEHFSRAVTLEPDFVEAQQNLAAARLALR